MNLFTNPNQRGPDLPPGCKDLIDVLRQPWRMHNSMSARPQPAQPPFLESGGLGELQFHVSCLLTSGTGYRILLVGCSEPSAFLALLNRGGEISVSLVVDSHQGKRLSALFHQAAISPISDSSTQPTGLTSALRFPLPKHAPASAQLVADILRKVFEVSDDTELCFHHSHAEAD